MKTLGDIGKLIEETPESKDSIKLAAFSELVVPFDFTTPKGKKVQIFYLKVNESIGALEVRVKVDGIWFSGDGVLQYINPPILVPDGTKSTVTTTIDGETYVREVDNFVEDLDKALELMVTETVGG